MLDANTGQRLHTFAGVDRETDWGYLAMAGDYLLGSSQKRPADEYSSWRRREGIRFLVSARDLVSRPTVSVSVFAYDLLSREIAWEYEAGGQILNSTITIGGGCVYFAESGNPTVTNDPSGTAALTDFFASDARLVALSLDSGQPRWSKPLEPLSSLPEDRHEHIMFLCYSDGKLLSTRTGHIQQKLSYCLRALEADSGEPIWKHVIPSRHRVYAPLMYGKNGQQSHPAIVAGRVYLLSHITDALVTIDLTTGEMTRDPDLYQFWIHSKTCAVPTASADHLFFRRDSCYMYDIPSSRAIDLTAVTRPSCWMSIIPAGGLILMPEASSGCSCGFALQTSAVLAPSTTRE
jgi:outer membrane protein assembly factor BamB